MMTERFRVTLSIGVCLLLWSVNAVIPQIRMSPLGPYLPTDRQLSVAAGGDAVIEPVIRDCLRESLMVERLRTDQIFSNPVRVLASQLASAWLPQLADVQFEALDDDAAATAYRQCRKVLWVDAGRSGDQLLVEVKIGHKCRITGATYRFYRSANGWSRREGEMPAGSVSGGECDCQ